MCRLEIYGNCDEETKDNEYCIFHKPNKNKEEAREFWRKFLERFKPKKEIISTEFGEVERFVFEDYVDCKGFVFPEDLSFQYSVFKKDVLFNEAIFEGVANFNSAIFEGHVWSSGATFEGNAKFDKAKFERNVWFNHSTFKRDANFNAKFKRYAFFKGATFKRDANFSGTTFKGGALFIGATFEGDANFTGKANDEKYKFYGVLSFRGAKFTSIDIDEPIKKGWFKLPQARAEACRVQRLSYEREGNKERADEIFRIERRSLRENRVWKAKSYMKEAKGKAKLKSAFRLIKAWVSSTIEWFLADLTCEYGTNWIKPVILWFFTVLFLFPFLYWTLDGVRVQSLFDYWYFSIVTATTLGYGDLHPIGFGKVLASAEAIFGTFMWTVFLVVFARKYMR